MSLHGTKELRQTVLEWRFYKTLNEYGGADDFNTGWHLDLNTAAGEFSISDHGWGWKPSDIKKRLTRRPYFSKGYVSVFGMGFDYSTPYPIGWNYTGDAISPEDRMRYYGV